MNTTVEVLPAAATANASHDGFVVVGRFGPAGVAQGNVGLAGYLRAIRLHVHSDSDNWVILSEV